MEVSFGWRLAHLSCVGYYCTLHGCYDATHNFLLQVTRKKLTELHEKMKQQKKQKKSSTAVEELIAQVKEVRWCSFPVFAVLGRRGSFFFPVAFHHLDR